MSRATDIRELFGKKPFPDIEAQLAGVGEKAEKYRTPIWCLEIAYCISKNYDCQRCGDPCIGKELYEFLRRYHTTMNQYLYLIGLKGEDVTSEQILL